MQIRLKASKGPNTFQIFKALSPLRRVTQSGNNQAQFHTTINKSTPVINPSSYVDETNFSRRDVASQENENDAAYTTMAMSNHETFPLDLY